VPDLVDEWYASVQESSFRHPRYAEVHAAVCAVGGLAGRVGSREWIDDVQRTCPDDTVRGLVTELAVEPLVTAGPVDARYATSIVARLLADEAGRQTADLKRELTRLDPVSQADRATALLADLVKLEAYRRELSLVGQDRS
jgi:DNA primase